MIIKNDQNAYPVRPQSGAIAESIGALFSHLEQHPRGRLIQHGTAGNQALTYPTLIAKAVVWSAHFAAFSIPAGTACILPMRNELATVCALFGALHHGLFPILMRPTTPPSLMHSVLERAGGGIAVVRPATGNVLRESAYLVAATQREGLQIVQSPTSSDAWISHTTGRIGLLSSGSTGAPKVIVHAIDRVLLNAQRHVQAIEVQRDDTVALSLPLSFSYGLVAGLFGTLLAGANGLLIDPQHFNLRRVLAEESPSICMGTPTSTLSAFDAHTLASLRRLTVGGDVLHHGLARQLLDAMPRGQVFATYGLTEAGPRVASQALDAASIERHGAVALGRPLEGVSLSLRCEADNPNLGELIVDTPTAMLGYLGDTAGSQGVLSDCGRLVCTGDMFERRGGEMFFIGRRKRIIVRGGENIYPTSIESIILRLAPIEDVWVTAQPHAQHGEVPVAYLRMRESVDINMLTRELRRHLPASHIPVHWEFVDELPEGARK